MNEIILELSKWQGSIGKPLHEGMMRVLPPRTLDVLSVKKVFKEATAEEELATRKAKIYSRLREAYGANGRKYVEWKWLIGPLPFPRS